MKRISNLLILAVLAIGMGLTSCEGLDDILGEWSRPTPGSSTGGVETTISIDPTLALKVGETGQLTATVNPAGTAVTWSSDQEAIATVDANGLVTAVAMGTAIITAKAGDKSATCEVTVTPDLSTPLTIEALTAGTIKVAAPQAGMQYSLNGGDKTAITDNPTEITVVAGDKVAFYGNGTTITAYCIYGTPSYDNTNDTKISGGTAQVKVYGNIMSLVDEMSYETATELTGDFAFSGLFSGNTKLTDISDLQLPATSLTKACYQCMFEYCTGLTTIPEALLPATTLANQCYEGMFCGCKALTTAPELKAETLAYGCYNAMFEGCTRLTAAPKLPAPALAVGCYANMFDGCTSLTTAPELKATTLEDYCYANMFANCTSLTTAYVKAAYSIDMSKCTNMFTNCTATGAKLHTTTASQTSWNEAISTRGWTTWTTVDDWN